MANRVARAPADGLVSVSPRECRRDRAGCWYQVQPGSLSRRSRQAVAARAGTLSIRGEQMAELGLARVIWILMSDLVGSSAARYAEDHTSPFDGPVAAVASWTQGNARWPGMMSGLLEARLLEALIVVGGARRALEIGTFTGVGALTMAAALPADGRVVTLEVDVDRAATARRHFDASPYGSQIELIVGDALETIAGLDGAFDLVYIDAWKPDYPAYYDAVLPKLAKRGVLVADNLFLGGAVLGASGEDGTVGIREFAGRVQQDEEMHNVLLTIGDGVMLAWRRPAGAR